jgi:hypothetical protein
LISPFCPSFKEEFLPEAQNVPGLRVIEGVPEALEKKGERGPLSLRFSQNGEGKEENFDLVVVLTRPKVLPEIQSMAKRLGQELH